MWNKRKLLTEKHKKTTLIAHTPIGMNVMLSISRAATGIEPVHTSMKVRKVRYRE